MAKKSKLIASWIEMSQGFIHNKPPRQANWNPYLFLNRVEVRERPSGVQVLMRRTDVEDLVADSKEAMEDAIQKFMLREDVRILMSGLETNDFRRLPREVKDPPQEIIDGTADIYLVYEAAV